MSGERMANDRRVAQLVASQDEHSALTEYERAAIYLARELLAALDELERLRAQREGGAPWA